MEQEPRGRCYSAEDDADRLPLNSKGTSLDLPPQSKIDRNFASTWCHPSPQYESGDRLSPEHEKTILERLFPCHPEFEKKIGPGIDFITVTMQDMVETFQRPFKMCVKQGDVSSVMCSFNKVNGIPSCADARLLSGTIQGEWNLHGQINADCDSIQTIFDQKWLDDSQLDAVAQVMKAGLDLDCYNFYNKYLEQAMLSGLVRGSDVDKTLFHNYMLLLRVGWFDGNPVFDKLGKSDICSQENIELATDAARQGIVLLKHDASLPLHLPLDQHRIKNIAVVGPHANATTDMIGNYADCIKAFNEVKG